MTRKFFEIGGIVAAAVLIAFGIAAIVMSVNGQSTVNDSLKQEQIAGSPDMTPTAIKGEVAAAQAAQNKLVRAAERGWREDHALADRDADAARSPASSSTPGARHAASRSTCGSTRSAPPRA